MRRTVTIDVPGSIAGQLNPFTTRFFLADESGKSRAYGIQLPSRDEDDRYSFQLVEMESGEGEFV